MSILPALIKGGASLIGGLLGKRSRDKANAANSPVAQVNQWKAAGINPLFGISSGAFIPQQASSFGDSFARAGGLFAESLEGAKEQELRETRLELENEQLRRNLDEQAKQKEQTAMQSAAVGMIPGVETYPTHVRTFNPKTREWGWMMNPDLAFGLEELAGTKANQEANAMYNQSGVYTMPRNRHNPSSYGPGVITGPEWRSQVTGQVADQPVALGNLPEWKPGKNSFDVTDQSKERGPSGSGISRSDETFNGMFTFDRKKSKRRIETYLKSLTNQ